MTKIYDKILAEQGEEAAKKYMASIRSKVKKPGLSHITDPELRRQKASQMAKIRWYKRKHGTTSQN